MKELENISRLDGADNGEDYKVVQTETFDLQGAPMDAYLGTKEEREAQAKKYIKGYEAQQTMLDKTMYFLYFEMKNFLTVGSVDPRYGAGQTEIEKSLSDDEKKSILAEEQKKYNESIDKRPTVGLSKTVRRSPEEEAAADEINKRFIRDLVGNGSRKAILEGLKSAQLISVYGEYLNGIDYKKNYDNLPEDTRLREKKATYLTSYNNAGIANLIASAKGAVDANIKMLLQPEENDEYGIGKILFDNLKYNKQMKMSTYFKSMGFTEYEKKVYCKRNNCNENETVYDVFKRRLEDEDAEIINSDTIRERVKKDYIKEYTSSILDEANASPKLFFQSHYTEDITMDEFMDMLKFNEVEKAAFLKQFKTPSTNPDEPFIYAKKGDSALGMFYNALNADKEALAEIKQNKIDRGERPEDAALIAPDDVVTYMQGVLESEADRFAFSRYKYKDTISIEKFLGSIGYKKDEVDLFIKERNITRDVPAISVMRMEYIKTLNAQQLANVKEEDVEKFASDFMENERNRLKSMGRPKVYINLSMAMREEFHDSLKTKEEKEIHKYGIAMVANEGVKPKTDPKKEPDKYYAKWVKEKADPYLAENFYNGLAQNFVPINDKLLSGKPLESIKNKDIQRYYDSNVVNTDTALLRGLIDKLEATKGGYGTGHKDTVKFTEMLKALKDYEYKLSYGDMNGIMDLKNTVITKCKKYVEGRESVRSANYGNDRFDVASTALYSLMSTEDFTRWAHAVNGKRSSDKLTWDRLATKQVQFLTTQQAKEEDIQNASSQSRVAKPKSYEAGFVRFEKLVGRIPQFDDKFDGVFLRDDYAEKFKPIDENERFVQIGPSVTKRNLSDQDFTAIVFAALHTPEVLAADTRLRNHFELKMLAIGKDLTTELAKDDVPLKGNRNIQVLADGRDAAINAMNEYAAGNKIPLAHILASGIRNVTAAARGMEKISDDIYMHAEMGVRIMEMINRDEQLKREVEANYDQGQSFKDDFEFVKNVKAMSDIHIKANNAEKFIAREVAKNPSGRYDAKTKEALVTDILVQQLVEDSAVKYNEKLKATASYKANEKKIAADYNKAKMALVKRGLENNLSEAEYKAEMNKIEDERKFNHKLLSVNRSNPVANSLGDKKNMDALRESVKKMVKDSGISKKSMKDIAKELKSPKFINKVAALSQQTREQRDKEVAEKRAAAQKEAAKKAAANAKKSAAKK